LINTYSIMFNYNCMGRDGGSIVGVYAMEFNPSPTLLWGLGL